MDPEQIESDRAATSIFYEMHPLLFDGTLHTVTVAAWLYDMELIFRTCHIEARLQVLLASRCLIAGARLWWMTTGQQQMLGNAWSDFRAIVMGQYGPVANEGVQGPYRDPVIYGDMYRRRYLNFAAEWQAYPNESMGHYCHRFREAMLPHIPQDLADPQWRAVQIIRDGLLPEVKAFVPVPDMGMTLNDMIDLIMEAEIMAHMVQGDALGDDFQVPVDDAGIGEPMPFGGPAPPEDPIPAVPIQVVPAEEANADDNADDDDDPIEMWEAPEGPPEDHQIIVISDDEEEEEEEEEFEEEWEQQDAMEVQVIDIEDDDDWDEDPEEIPIDGQDWDDFSEISEE